MYDSTEMYELGNAFLNVADTCFVEGKIKNRSEYQNVAGVVNLAFAAEIYLKCLLNINGKQIRGHKLFELWNEFKNINSQEAKDIENAVLDQIVTDLMICLKIIVMLSIITDISMIQIAFQI